MKRAAHKDDPVSLGNFLRLCFLKVDCLGAARVGLNVKGYLLTFRQLGHARLLDRRNVNEDILRAIFGGNEAEASRNVKKLHGTCRH